MNILPRPVGVNTTGTISPMSADQLAVDPVTAARRLLGASLSAAGRVDEAKTTIASVAAQCAQLGMLRYLVDGGPYVAATLAELHADQRSGQWRPEWPEVPSDFLQQAINAEVAQRV